MTLKDINKGVAKLYGKEPIKEAESLLLNVFIGKQNEVIATCLDIIKWYENTTAPSLPELFENRKKLAAQSVYLGLMTGLSGKYFRSYHVQRKVQFSRDTYDLTSGDEKMAVSRAEHKAYADTADLREREAMGEAAHESGVLVLRQVNQVLTAMTQEISDLRNEQRNENY